MAPRLSHKKSRKGCTRCKTRKVKCTEEKPACLACVRHSLPCDYDRETQPDRSTSRSRMSNTHRSAPAEKLGVSTASAGKSSSVLGPTSPYSLEDDVEAPNSDHFTRRLLELRLLHHYTTVVARTMPASKGDAQTNPSHDIRSLYVADTVEYGFEYPFLLNTIFALAALHKTRSQPHFFRVPTQGEPGAEVAEIQTNPEATQVSKAAEVAKYARAHRIYLNMAIRQQREALADLNSANADAVCLTSVLLSIIALKLLPEDATPHYSPPIQWLHMAHAISTVIQASLPFLPPHSIMRRVMTHNEPDFNDKRNIFEFEHIQPFRAILDFSGNQASVSEEDSTYNLAVSYMAAIYRGIQANDPHRQIARRLASTGPVLPKLFVELVEQRRPKALVILAYIMCMIKYVDDYWFFHGMAEHEVYGIRSTLPNEWQWAMEWPAEMLTILAEPKYRNSEA